MNNDLKKLFAVFPIDFATELAASKTFKALSELAPTILISSPGKRTKSNSLTVSLSSRFLMFVSGILFSLT